MYPSNDSPTIKNVGSVRKRGKPAAGCSPVGPARYSRADSSPGDVIAGRRNTVLAVSADDVRRAVLEGLEHDRWNSNLTDDHIAEKVAATLRKASASADSD